MQDCPSHFSLVQEHSLETSVLKRQISLAVTLHEKIPSLRQNNFLSKKTALIQHALLALDKYASLPPESLMRVGNLAREGREFPHQAGIYKSQRNSLHESIFWELAILLGCDRFIAPSLRVSIHGKEATFQPYFDVQLLPRFVSQKTPLPFEIALPQYWMLSLYTILMGHCDLNGTNLHFNAEGFILLDNDCCLPPFNAPLFSEGFLRVPIQSVLLDLSPAARPIMGKDYAAICHFLSQWHNQREDILSFLSAFSLNADSLNCFWERFEALMHAPLKEGDTLICFFKAAFPKFLSHIEEAQRLVGEEMGPISTLHFISAFSHNNGLPLSKEIVQWMQQNHSQTP